MVLFRFWKGIGITCRNLFWLSEELGADRATFADRCSRRRAVDDCHQRAHASFKSGCRWCDCPPEYGPTTTIYNRFVRWPRRGLRENLFRELARCGRSADTQMIDSAHVKAHRAASGGKGEKKQAVGRSRGGRNTKIHALAEAKGPKQRSDL